VSSSTAAKARPLERNRSRSLSVSLAQERERERERSVGLGAAKKRVLNREISMSRVFKPKAKVPEAKVTSKRKRPEGDISDTLPKVKDEGVTLVVDTPVKPKTGIKTTSASVSHSKTENRNIGMTLSLPSLGGVVQHGDDNDDEWCLSNPPDIMLLVGKSGTSKRGGLGSSDGEDDLWSMGDTPSKRKRPRVR
jgi:hypothetical protein